VGGQREILPEATPWILDLERIRRRDAAVESVVLREGFNPLDQQGGWRSPGLKPNPSITRIPRVETRGFLRCAALRRRFAQGLKAQVRFARVASLGG
jgi:hypothetical protein